MIDATIAPKVGFVSPFGTIVCNVNHINAGRQPLPEAAATQERRLEAVGWTPLILIEAPSSAYHGGRLRLGNITCERGGDRKAIVHHAAPIVLRYRPPGPDEGPLPPRPARRAPGTS